MRRLAGWVAAGLLAALPVVSSASDFSEPWKRDDRAIVIDAYEYNPIDWEALGTDKRITGFIAKGSDGLPPPYRCRHDDETDQRLCSALWKRYAVARELFHSRRTIARALGLEWGAYHLGRPGNPVEQANHFIDFAAPGPRDLVAIDIEENDPEKWMSLEDAEVFSEQIRRRIGRYPVLYTNGTTAKHIADHRDRYPLLSRLPLWYARYKPEIGMHFPKGHWESYALWQFSSQANCGPNRCPYRVPGTRHDIDVNVASVDAEALRAAWPFGGTIDATPATLASVPVPIPRRDGLSGPVSLAYVPVSDPLRLFAKAFKQAGNRYPPLTLAAAKAMRPIHFGLAELLSWRKDVALAYRHGHVPASGRIDPIMTGGTPVAPDSPAQTPDFAVP